MLRFITDFADQAVVLPMAVTFALALAAQRWWRAALGWPAATVVVLGVMLAVKTGFAACGGVAWLEDLRNPSGHTAVAGLVAGGVARVFAGERRPTLALPALAGLLAAIVIGVTRVAIGDHTVGDVVAATPIGVGGAMLAAGLMGPPPSGTRPVYAVLPVLAVGLVTHGMHLQVESSIRSLALWMPLCRVSS